EGPEDAVTEALVVPVKLLAGQVNRGVLDVPLRHALRGGTRCALLAAPAEPQATRRLESGEDGRNEATSGPRTVIRGRRRHAVGDDDESLVLLHVIHQGVRGT